MTAVTNRLARKVMAWWTCSRLELASHLVIRQPARGHATDYKQCWTCSVSLTTRGRNMHTV